MSILNPRDFGYLSNDEQWISWFQRDLQDDYEFHLLSEFVSKVKSLEHIEAAQFFPDPVPFLLPATARDKLHSTHRYTAVKTAFFGVVFRALLMQEVKSRDILSWESFTVRFSIFQTLDTTELVYLFRNALVIMFVSHFLPARQNKTMMCKMAEWLEGSGEVYNTGGKARPATRRRLFIFQSITGVSPRTRTNATKRRAEDSVQFSVASTDIESAPSKVLKKRKTKTTKKEKDNQTSSVTSYESGMSEMDDCKTTLDPESVDLFDQFELTLLDLDFIDGDGDYDFREN